MLTAVFAPFVLVPNRAAASETAQFLTSNETILLAVFGGAMSFAIMSAFWLIRERGRILADNTDMRMRIGGLRAANEKLEALVNSADQRIVVWDGPEQKPAIFGRLAGAEGAPAESNAFLAFGKWLAPDSAMALEAAQKKLRTEAESFDLVLILKNGGILEAQGRTSGSHAFIRFSELTAERAARSRLQSEHERLRATLELIQGLFEQLPNPVWMRGMSGALLWANSAYANAVECEDAGQAVDTDLDLLDRSQRQLVEAAQRENPSYRGALPIIIAGDRREFDIAEHCSPAGRVGIATDRGEIEEIRAMLRQTTASHAQTLDHLATAVAMFDKNQQLQFYNSSFQQLWNLGEGFLSAGPTNAQLLDALRAENRLPEFPDWRKWRESQLEIYQALEPREDWWHLPGGETLRVVCNPHRQGGATWVFENVTEQLTLQSNYNALMRVQGETLDSLKEAIAVFGLDGKLRLCNPAFQRFWNRSGDEIASGMHIGELTKLCGSHLAEPEDWNAIVEAVTGFEDSRDNFAGRIETKAGAIHDYGLVRLPEGQTLLALTDVTASVQVERALKERNEALEQSDHLKNRFIQHVSYELRAPLTSIAGFSELLSTPEIGTLTPKQGEYVGHISESAEALKAIIDDILDLATIDAGAMMLDFEQTGLRETISDCAEEMQDVIAAKGLRLEIDIAPEAEDLEADPRRLRQIIRNLMRNAAGFSPDGGRIRMTGRRRDDFIEISVADEGPGIPDDMREKIFGRFEVHSSRSRPRGVGLGLSIAQSFVQLHGGEIRVENAGERGARFVVCLPDRQNRAVHAA